MFARLMSRMTWSSFPAVGFSVFFYMPWLLTENVAIAIVGLTGLILAGLSLALVFHFCHSSSPQTTEPGARNARMFLAVLAAGVPVSLNHGWF